jgi:glycosyltransferase involved in cell wall biosynthesis
MTAEKPQIALIIPCYNEAEALPDFFARVLQVCDADQTNFRMIAVDDGSSDGTFEAWKKYADSTPEVEVQVILFRLRVKDTILPRLH